MKDLDYFFNPRSVAIVGVSRHPKKFGHVIFQNFLESKFEGKVYPINPNTETILGEKCYSSIKNVPDQIDLAVISIPAMLVASAVKECAEKGVKACIILSAGFGEIGKKEEEKNLLKSAKGMRIIGPNVLGIYDSFSNVDTVFNIRYRQERPKKGMISFVSQSGALGAAVMDWASSENIGLSKFISIGNRVDVDEVDILEYLNKDNRTGVIALYIEGTRRGRKLFDVLCNMKKPVIVMKAGKSAAGTKAVASHTGSLAGSTQIFSGMLRQAGAIEASSTEELFDFAKAFLQPSPKGRRIQIVTNGGGFGVLAADAVAETGLEMAEMSAETNKMLKKSMPQHVSLSNPLDLTGDADSARYESALNAAMNDENVDGIITILLMQISVLGSEVVDLMTNLSKKQKKPILVCSTGGEFTNIHKKMLEESGIPVYPSPQRAVKAMKVLVDYKYR